ncbi:MAG: 6-bladed beta-propeller, partial [Bacteroidaceae bacterium]|nr:6-bladed beta-propeller [Bacteroidaceae bacterium]
MRNILFAFLTAASLLCACKGNIHPGGTMQITKDDVIHLDGTLEDNFMKSWEYILLDESTDALLGTINDAIRYDDGLFFIHSDMDKASTIKVFDRSGHYLNDIGRIGRARNEYLSLDSWNLDTHRNEVLIVNGDGYDGKATIKRFDYQGKFLGQIDIDSIGKEYVTVNGFAKCYSDGSLLMKDYMHSFPTYDYFILHTDGSASPLFEMSEYHQMHAPVDPALVLQQGGFKNENMNWGHEIVSGVFNLHSDTTYLTRALDNHIYRICG